MDSIPDARSSANYGSPFSIRPTLEAVATTLNVWLQAATSALSSGRSDHGVSSRAIIPLSPLTVSQRSLPSVRIQEQRPCRTASQAERPPLWKPPTTDEMLYALDHRAHRE